MKIIDLLHRSWMDHPGNIAINYDSQEISYQDLYERILSNKAILEKYGLRKGDHCLILMDNCPEFIEAFFSINLCGGVILPIFTGTGLHKLQTIIKFYEINYIFLTENFASDLKKLVEDPFGDNRHFRNVFCFNHCRNEITAVFKKEDFHSWDSKNQGTIDTRIAVILFSSGTTNIPKGVMLSDNNIISNVYAINEYLKIKSTDRIFLIKSLNHASSITGEMLVSLANGATLFLTSKLTTPGFILRALSKYSITLFFAVPSILYSLLDYKHILDYNLRCLQKVNFYGASISYERMQELLEVFPHVKFIYSYGLTEASPRVTYFLCDEWEFKRGSSGKPIKDVEVFILSERGIPLFPFEIGEIAVKGPNVMLGYYKNKELSDRTLHNDILHTGDLGFLDEEGYLYISGRKDNLMIQFGRNIFPEEIESIILLFPGINEVLVRGEQDEFLGDKTVAYIVQNKPLSINELIAFCRLHLEDYKIPKEVIAVDILEKTTTGKVIRNQKLKREKL